MRTPATWMLSYRTQAAVDLAAGRFDLRVYVNALSNQVLRGETSVFYQLMHQIFHRIDRLCMFLNALEREQ